MWTDAFNGKQEIARYLDAQAFNGREKLLKRSLQTFFLCEFLRVLLFIHTFTDTWS